MSDQTVAVRILRIVDFIPAEESETGQDTPVLEQIAEVVDSGWSGLDQVAGVIEEYVNNADSYDEEGGIYPLVYMMPVEGEDPEADASWEPVDLEEVMFDLLRSR